MSKFEISLISENLFDANDVDFTGGYVDVDELRESPTPHRYIHGGFASNETKFSMYLPPTDAYQGRFFQHFTPVPDSENMAADSKEDESPIGFACESGGYYLETNGGGRSQVVSATFDPSFSAYRANAACAEFSRSLAAKVFGPHRIFGYAYGGSGGSYRTIAAAEATKAVWDGFVPFVPGSPMSLPNVFSVRMHAMRVLKDKLDDIVDALDVGGSGDPLATLNAEEAEAFLEVTRMGFPPKSWFAHRIMGVHAFSVLYSHLAMMDPEYFESFWEVPGYLGAEPDSSVRRARLKVSSEVLEVLTRDDCKNLGIALSDLPSSAHGGVDTAFTSESIEGSVVALRLKEPLTKALQTALLTTASGSRFNLSSGSGDIVIFDEQEIGTRVSGIAVGDTVEIDNSNFLAAQTYHRHQVPSADYAVWDQFRNSDGTPKFPQRRIVGPMMAMGAGGGSQSGSFAGKMIMVACLLDREAFPWQADWYSQRVRSALGAAYDDNFRLWYVENSPHGDTGLVEFPTWNVSYIGVLNQALRDLAAWVENSVTPPDSTAYEIVDGQVIVPVSAAERRGVQPALTLLANGVQRAEVSTGEPVDFEVFVDIPPAGGQVVSIEWDLEGVGHFAPGDGSDSETNKSASFAKPGTYFVAVRVTTQRTPSDSPHARILNVARVRILVE